MTVRCPLCNEHIEREQMPYLDIVKQGKEYWHAECFAEYYGEVLEEV